MADSGAVGRNNAHEERVLLFCWYSPCGRTRRKTMPIHWGVEPPKPEQIVFECLGAVNDRSLTFFVEGVTTQSRKPSLELDEEVYLIHALRQQLEFQTGWRVLGLRREVVDWVGIAPDR